MIKINKEEMGDLITDNILIPQNTIEIGTHLIDGILFRYDSYKSAESDLQLVIELPRQGVIIAQDLAYNGYHLWLGENLEGWIQALKEIKKKYYNIVLGGHGLPKGPKIYDFLIKI